MINSTGGGNQLIHKLEQELQEKPQKEQDTQQVSAQDQSRFEDALNDKAQANESSPNEPLAASSKPVDPMAAAGKPIDPLAASDKAQPPPTAGTDVIEGVDKLRSEFKDAVSALHGALQNQNLPPAAVQALNQLREISGLSTAEGLATDVTSKLDQDMDTLLKSS